MSRQDQQGDQQGHGQGNGHGQGHGDGSQQPPPTGTSATVIDAATFEQQAFSQPPAQQAALGRIVRVGVDPALNGGADVVTGIIVAVKTFATSTQPAVVNLRLWLDSGTGQGAEWVTGRYLWPDEATARTQTDPTAWAAPGSVGLHAFWPART